MSQRYKIETPCSLPDKCMGIDCNSKPVKLLRIEPFSFEDCFYYCEPCLRVAVRPFLDPCSVCGLPADSPDEVHCEKHYPCLPSLRNTN